MLNNNYVRSSPEAMAIIETVNRLIFKSNGIEWIKDRSEDITFLVPRLPHTLLFAIGGWVDSSACDLLEIYNSRADRWIRFEQFDNTFGQRAYHRAVNIGNKIYCIGGYCNNEYFNKCAVLDVIKREWKEVRLNCCQLLLVVCVYFMLKIVFSFSLIRLHRCIFDGAM